MHIYQESEQHNQTSAFTGTITNFFARLLISVSFVFLVGIFPLADVDKAAILWGMSLLAILTYLVARERKVKPIAEVIKHLLAASAVVVASTLIPPWISELFG